MDMDVQIQVDKDWRNIAPLLADAVQKVARDIEADAKINITNNKSVRTGDMRRSITSRQIPGSQGLEWLVGSRGAGSDYAPHVEFGTIHFKGKPFMIPAIKKNKPKFSKAVKDVMDRRIGD